MLHNTLLVHSMYQPCSNQFVGEVSEVTCTKVKSKLYTFLKVSTKRTVNNELNAMAFKPIEHKTITHIFI